MKMTQLPTRSYIKSSISVALTAVSIPRPFVFTNGKADKTFNMFKLASISIRISVHVHLAASICPRESVEMKFSICYVSKYATYQKIQDRLSVRRKVIFLKYFLISVDR